MASKDTADAVSSHDDANDAIRIHAKAIHVLNKDHREKRSKSKDRHSVVNAFNVADPTTHVLRPAMEELCYANDFLNRGVCLIVEYDQFRSDMGLSSRKGSEVDLKACNELFGKMGFDVYIQKNLPYVELIKMFERVAAMDHSDSDCLAIVILSHGTDGTLYAYDAAFPTQKIWEPFTANRAPTLAGKPKLFFIQACQGNQMDSGIRLDRVKPIRVTQTDSFASYKVPVHADFLIAHSTIAGFYSWRNTAQGSWYMQTLARVMEKERNDRDVLSMLTMVNKIVTQEYESNSSRPEYNDKKQTPFIYSTLTYKFYLESKKIEST